jgi:hypothetical protein
VRTSVGLALVALASLVAGCGAILGLDADFSEGGGGASTSGHGGGGHGGATASAGGAKHDAGAAGGGGVGGTSSSHGGGAGGATTTGQGGAGGTTTSQGGAGGTTTTTSGAGGVGGQGGQGGQGGATTTTTSDAGGSPCSAGTVCTPMPMGWLGPFIVHTGASGQVDACEPGWQGSPSPLQPIAGTALAGMCTQSCSMTGGKCGTAQVGVFQQPSCAGPEQALLVASGQCTPTSAYALRAGVESVGLEPTCTPTAGPPDLSPPEWTAQGRACSPTVPPASCGPDGACTKSGARVCVAQSGNVDCPAGFPGKTTLVVDYADHRTCSASLCGPPVAVSCDGGVLQMYADGSCGSFLATVPLDGATCGSPGALAKSVAISGPAVPHGGCPSGMAAPSGSVDATSQVTYCCQP